MVFLQGCVIFRQINKLPRGPLRALAPLHIHYRALPEAGRMRRAAAGGRATFGVLGLGKQKIT